MSCVVGKRDDYRMQKVKAFVMLKEGIPKTEETKAEILAYCSKQIARYAMPKEIEFRDEFPKTAVGKVSYRELEKEENTEKEAILV
jgi:long-chain acyl-CoA synthetase